MRCREDPADDAEEKTEEDDPIIAEPSEVEPSNEGVKLDVRRLTKAKIAAAVAARTPPARRSAAVVRAATGSVKDAGEREPTRAASVVAVSEQRQELEDEIDRAARDVVRAVTVQRVEAAELGIEQLRTRT
jgi:hypothetical protein